MSKGRAKAPSQRQLRVGEELRHILAQVLERGGLHDPAVQDTPITVTEVRASPDLKNATAFVVPLGGDAAVTDRVLEGLNRAAPYLRRVLAEKVRLRHTPRINFLECDVGLRKLDTVQIDNFRPPFAHDNTVLDTRLNEDDFSLKRRYIVFNKNRVPTRKNNARHQVFMQGELCCF